MNDVLGWLARLALRAGAADDLDTLFTEVLVALQVQLGHPTSMLFLADVSRERLYAVATHGYAPSGVGAEVPFGHGVVGTVARTRQPVGVTTLGRQLRYARAVRSALVEAGGDGVTAEIPLPGLVDVESQLAVPLLAGGDVRGVLLIESPKVRAYGDDDVAVLSIVASLLAGAVCALTEEELTPMAAERDDVAAAEATTTIAPVEVAVRRRRFIFHERDESVFVDGEYLIKNVPGRILWRLLSAYVDEGQREFTNRRLRVDAWLKLPDVKDNLESRLILLRRRLELKCPDVRLVHVTRGRFALDVSCGIDLVVER